jgi:ribosomal protein L24E
MSSTVVIGVNIGLGIAGLAVVAAAGKALSGWCGVTPSDLKTFTQTTVLAMLFAGLLLFGCSLLGCFAVSKKHRGAAKLYVAMLMLVYIVQGAATYFVMNDAKVISQVQASGVKIEWEGLTKERKVAEAKFAYDVVQMYNHGQCKGTPSSQEIAGVTIETDVKCEHCSLLENAFKVDCNSGALDNIDGKTKCVAGVTAMLTAEYDLATAAATTGEGLLAYCACRATFAEQFTANTSAVYYICGAVLFAETVLLLSACYLACSKKEEVMMAMGREPLHGGVQMHPQGVQMNEYAMA